MNIIMAALWDSFYSGMIDYAMSAYDPFGIWKYPALLLAIIGFIYASMQSAIVAIVGILFTFAIYGMTTNIFASVPDLNLFLYIITIMGIALLFTALFIKRRS